MNVLEYNCYHNNKPLSIIVTEMLACTCELGISNSVHTPANGHLLEMLSFQEYVTFLVR